MKEKLCNFLGGFRYRKCSRERIDIVDIDPLESNIEFMEKNKTRHSIDQDMYVYAQVYHDDDSVESQYEDEEGRNIFLKYFKIKSNESCLFNIVICCFVIYSSQIYSLKLMNIIDVYFMFFFQKILKIGHRLK